MIKHIKSFFVEIGRTFLMLKHGKKCGWKFNCHRCEKECCFNNEV